LLCYYNLAAYFEHLNSSLAPSASELRVVNWCENSTKTCAQCMILNCAYFVHQRRRC